ncbi:cell division protein FtsK [Citricoccus sp. SGAir0253]|uniref:FtsK/SpoIIIE domain-containing protein n=1 Tax=Citricoccus sp. SGAir0253 TaxID=2567881 RepID=UPI0010CCBCBB|nr:FtsK/SpoIIIE domain-containing protein [Citricoccus sp. SGAir0253]QCU78480.1 cell division protein FtsK [Citricoccus sp. SGAir0253]
MWLRILGLPDGAAPWWAAHDLGTADGADVEVLLRRHLPGHRFTAAGRPLGRLTPAALQGVPSLTVVARPATSGESGREGGPEVVMVTASGPDAGLLAALPRSGLTVGRNQCDVRVADPFLSAPHFRVVVEPEGVRIEPLGDSTGHPGRRPGTARGHVTGAEPWTRGTTDFRLVRGRPGPLGPRSPLPPLAVDPGPEPTRPNALLQVVMALGPLVVGLALALATGHWFFLLFSLVSVAVAAVMWTQHRTARARHGRRIRREADDLAARVAAVAPGPGALALASRAAVPDRFGVHGASPGPPAVRWGTATATLPVGSAQDRDDWASWSRTCLAVVTELHPGATTRVFGRRSTLDHLVPWLVVQLCRDAVATARGILVRTAEGDSWLGGGRDAAEGTAILAADASRAGIPAGWHLVVLGRGDRVEGLGQGDAVRPDEGTATVGGLEYTGLRWDGLSPTTAARLVDELGASPRPPHRQAPPGLDWPEPGLSGSATAGLRCTLAGGAEPVTLDLVGDGPHVLVAGTTGSGKSELLLTALVGLAAEYPPAEVSYVLMDFKGGSSFAPLSGLPHTMSVETNLVEAESLRTVDALTAELHRREELFLAAGSPDYAAHRRAHPDQLLPRLVVAVDELRVLVEDHPRAASVLARLAATGRSLGFHLLLATQRAQGAVSPDVRSNLGTVVCLRTATEQESWDVLGAPDAHGLDPDRPGHAFIRHGGGPLRAFRAGRFARPPGPPWLEPWDGTTTTARDPDAAPWAGLVQAVADRTAARGLRLPEPVVTPALPDRWVPTEADHRAAGRDAVVLGLADLPRHRRREPVTWEPGRDVPVAWIGVAAGGLHDAARSVIAQLARRAMEHADRPNGTAAAPLAPHTVVLDGVGDLQAGSGLPPNWTVLSPATAPAERLEAAFDGIGTELSGRRPVHVVITGWGRWSVLRVGSGYETVEERLGTLLRDHPPSVLAVALFGGRELAGGRVLAQVPRRFYLPSGSTPEQRMVWPTLHRVPEVPGRAVMVSPGEPAPGIAVQLALRPPARPAEPA